MNHDGLKAYITHITPEFLTHDQITGNKESGNNRSEREFLPQEPS